MGFLLLLALVAAASTSRGVWNALLEGQSQDLWLVCSWLEVWLRDGVNPYDVDSLGANYPPHAIAFLSPLTLVPWEARRALVAIAGMLLAPVACIGCLRASGTEIGRGHALAAALLFSSWAAVRIGLGNGQLSLVMMSFGIAGLVLVERNEVAAGALIGLALMKPHVGFAFFLWAALARRGRVVVAAGCVALAGWALFAVRLGIGPAESMLGFVKVLRRQFGDEGYIVGATELRPLVHGLVPSVRAAETLTLVATLGSLVLLVVFALRVVGMRRDPAALVGPCCAWGLLAVFHGSYDGILLLPAMCRLGFGFGASTEAGRSPDVMVAGLAQLALMAEVPGLAWKLGIGQDTVAGAAMFHADRLLVVALFVFLLWRDWPREAVAREVPGVLPP